MAIDPLTKDQRYLFNAVTNGPLKLTEAFLKAAVEKDPSILTLRDPWCHNRTLPIIAAWNGRRTLLDIMLDARANPNDADAEGTTASMLAAARGHVDCLESLDRAGADFTQEDNDGGTTLAWAEIANERKRRRTIAYVSTRIAARSTTVAPA